MSSNPIIGPRGVNNAPDSSDTTIAPEVVRDDAAKANPGDPVNGPRGVNDPPEDMPVPAQPPPSISD